jgi:hypothetical protein
LFSITKLSKQSQDFVSTMTQGGKSRAMQTSLALAKVLSTNLQLPSAPVEDITQYFRTQCQIDVESTLNVINEIMLVDAKTTADLVRKFYSLRYCTAHPSCHVFAFAKDSAVEDFFGISREFDKASIETIKMFPAELSTYVNHFKKMVEELKS